MRKRTKRKLLLLEIETVRLTFERNRAWRLLDQDEDGMLPEPGLREKVRADRRRAAGIKE